MTLEVAKELGKWTIRAILVLGAVIAHIMEKEDAAEGLAFAAVWSFILL